MAARSQAVGDIEANGRGVYEDLLPMMGVSWGPGLPAAGGVPGAGRPSEWRDHGREPVAERRTRVGPWAWLACRTKRRTRWCARATTRSGSGSFFFKVNDTLLITSNQYK
jgi:hypothetical protein